MKILNEKIPGTVRDRGEYEKGGCFYYIDWENHKTETDFKWNDEELTGANKKRVIIVI